MIGENQETLYIVLSYAGVGVVVAAMIASALWSGHRARARIAALEAQGIRRRSAGTAQ